MELALTSIHYLYECSLFDCVLNVRKLHVLLGKSFYKQTCLPIMYIRSSLPILLSLMHIFFADAGTTLEMLRNSSLQSSLTPQSLHSSSGHSPHRKLSNKSEGGTSKTMDFNLLLADFVFRHRSSAPLAVVVCRAEERQKYSDKGKERTESASRWEPIYMISNLDENNFMSNRRGQGPHLNQNLPIGCEIGLRSGASIGNTPRGKKWPFIEWSGIEKVLTDHQVDHCSEPESTKPAKYCIESVSVKKSTPNNDASDKIQRHSSSSMRSKVVSHCHVSFITDSTCLVVIQCVANAKRHRASDDEIAIFMQTMVLNLCPENVLSIQVAMCLKFNLSSAWDGPPDRSETSTLADDHAVPTTSLWSESGWSDTRRKNILFSLGLQRKGSPVMAPLKSPYVKRQMSGRKRQRKKKTKNSINHAHIPFFLGPELSNLL